MTAVLVALGAGILVWLLSPGRGRQALSRLQPTPAHPGEVRVPSLAAVVAVGACVLIAVLLGMRIAGWALAGAIIVGTIAGLIWRAVNAIEVRRAEREVARVARVIASQLRIGQMPAAALREAASDAAILAPVAAAAQIGGSVPDTFRSLSRHRGHHGLVHLAAAWELSQRTGAPVADIVERVAEELREDEAMAAGVATEVAGARTTGRVMAVLPLAGLGLGFAAGGNPLTFIATTWIGEVLFVAGVGLAAVGVWWLEKLADSAMPGGQER